MDLKSEIEKIRPNIKPNSLNAYVIILRKLNDDKEVQSLNFLKEKQKIVEKIMKRALTTQRNYLGAVLVALPILKNSEELLEFYKGKLEKVSNEYQDIVDSHKKTDKQEVNWSSMAELSQILSSYKKAMLKINTMREKLTQREFFFLTNYVVVALFTLIPPTRLDYAPMSIIENDKEDNGKKNYLVNKSRNKKYFIINEYKSSKSYGKQIIKIPSGLNSILNLYLKFHKDKSSFLLNSRGTPLTANGLSKLLTSSFGRYSKNKKITLNLIRHIYISENVKLTKDTDESKLANSMMHSASTQQTYIKV
jgi:hypothetical protein